VGQSVVMQQKKRKVKDYIADLEPIYKVNLNKSESLALHQLQRSVNQPISISEILVSREFSLLYKSALRADL
jgi:hypothetical protein